MATEMGAEVVQVKSNNVPSTIVKIAEEKQITTICIGLPKVRLWQVLLKTSSFSRLINKLSGSDIDLVLLS
jgi:two-component system sensor histidine kinase KdpD